MTDVQERPVTAVPGPAYVVGGPTGYDEVVGFTKVLPAMRPLDELPHPDFLLFQSLHVMTELCWYNMHFEINRAAAELDGGRYGEATRLLERAVRLQRLASDHLDHLRDMITQADFLQIRGRLPGNDSGTDSPGARNLHRVARHAWLRFADAVHRQGAEIRDLFGTGPSEVAPRDGEVSGLAEVAQALMQLDDALLDWQQVHQRLVWSRVGGHPSFRERHEDADRPTGMSGRPVDLLDKFAVRLHFPELWREAQAVASHEAAHYA
ncbi:tryptophan 2,3-dioxygenase [Streptomyces zaomyceticus]|uniref:hypothetical protein n=1 Tax=Streptomyces zaomyceticus TaxID=68286 RepID=UPI0016758E0C|nr:hypothetical protein [Streptomyces zaomyceticus]GHG16727.1 hypothetical protein GCM10018791_34140 [Streptomyces zaomyceticus]